MTLTSYERDKILIVAVHHLPSLPQNKREVPSNEKSSAGLAVEYRRNFNNFKESIAPVFKWNLSKQWEWKPFTASNESELGGLKNMGQEEKHGVVSAYSNLRKSIANQIAVTVESHLLPDPRLSKEALEDFIKFWGHSEFFAPELRKEIQYFASLPIQFSEKKIQTIAKARNFFSDKIKMEGIRQNIFEDKRNVKGRRDFFVNLVRLKNMASLNL